MDGQLFRQKLAQVSPVFGITIVFLTLLFTNLNAQTMKVKNVVLVHGAFADGSGWKGVYEVLTKKRLPRNYCSESLIISGR